MQTLTELEMLESTYMFYTVSHHAICPHIPTALTECLRRRIMGTTLENTG